MSILYHKEIYLPENLVNPLFGRKLSLEFTRHAQVACVTDRYGIINPPKTLVINKLNLFEVEVDNGEVVKVTVRLDYTPKFDLIMAVDVSSFKNGCGRVKTVYLNRKTDNHKSLDKSKYTLDFQT